MLSKEELKSFKTKINTAFRELRKNGYVAKQNFTCCQSCGWAEMPEDNNLNVFYHAQDNDSLKERGDFYLSWMGDGAKIAEIFENAGLLVGWEGSDAERIHIFNK